MQRYRGARAVLQRARDACDEDLLVLKGLSIASRYPVEHLRPMGDLDLLSSQPERTQTALLSAGFQPVGPFPDDYYDGLHHLRPLQWPGVVGPVVEVHRRANWVSWRTPPKASDLMGHGVPASFGVGDVLELSPEANAIVLTAHSWGELPLRRIGDLFDLRVVLRSADIKAAQALARAWGLDRVLRTSLAASQAVFEGASPTTPLRSWARNLTDTSETKVYEAHIRRWCAPFWATTPRQAVRLTSRELLNDLLPTPDESWSNKVTRIWEAVRHPKRSQADHQAVLGPTGIRPRHQRIFEHESAPDPPDPHTNRR
jgi:hypothetical protein